MRYVLDASVLLKWVLNEPNVDAARKLREEFVSSIHELLSPDLYLIEVAHGLSKAHRRREITEEQANAYLADVLSTPPQFHQSAPLLTRAFELSLQIRCGVYECIYAALAEVEGCEVIT